MEHLNQTRIEGMTILHSSICTSIVIENVLYATINKFVDADRI